MLNMPVGVPDSRGAARTPCGGTAIPCWSGEWRQEELFTSTAPGIQFTQWSYNRDGSPRGGVIGVHRGHRRL